jgi:hypothetical protein
MEKITCTSEDMAAAFTEWERRYREEPDRFMEESERLLRQTPETYGEACAPYFLQLLREVGEASTDPRRRMAMDWILRREGVRVEPQLPTTLPARAAAKGTLDYITAGLARFRESAKAGGFDVGEVTLSFDEDQERVLLKVSLGIEVELLDHPTEAGSEKAEEPGLIEYRAQQPCECHVPKQERRFRQDPVHEPLCVPCWARACLEQAASGSTGPS